MVKLFILTLQQQFFSLILYVISCSVAVVSAAVPLPSLTVFVLTMILLFRTGDSRGFAFVRYKYADEAQKAVDRLDGIPVIFSLLSDICLCIHILFTQFFSSQEELLMGLR